MALIAVHAIPSYPTVSNVASGTGLEVDIVRTASQDISFSQYECKECSSEIANCKQCGRQYNYEQLACEECSTGHYLASKYECKPCSRRCLMEPTGDFLCDIWNGNCSRGCRTGYYFQPANTEDVCQECSSHCLPGSPLCRPSDGLCSSGCEAGYYFHAGHSTDVCQPCNSNCIPKSSSTPSCRQSDGFCSGGCKDGYYGTRCDIPCPENCVNRVCERETGTCTEGCLETYFGASCTDDCSSNCLVCDQFTGSCVQCNAGFYGNSCQTRCPGYCGADSLGLKLCDITTGDCINKCQEGYYGRNCTDHCYVQCDPYQDCDMDTGRCTRCQEGYYGDQCRRSCKLYCLMYKDCRGSNCNRNEPTCGREDGSCTFGCLGDYCPISSANMIFNINTSGLLIMMATCIGLFEKL